MVKERRAFEVKSVQDTLPGYKPQLGSTVPVRDYANEMEAMQYSTGMHIMPNVFKTVNDINQEFVDFYRDKEFYTESSQIEWDAKLAEENNRQFKINVQREQDGVAHDLMMNNEADIIDTYNETKRIGGNVTEALQKKFESMNKSTNDLYTKYSPYIADQVTKHARSLESQYLDKGITADAEITEVRTEGKIKSSLAMARVMMMTGKYDDPKDVSNIINAPGKAMQSFLNTTNTLANNLSFKKKMELFNNGFQSLVLQQASRIAEDVADGSMSKKDGENAILTLVSKYANYQANVTDAEGNEENLDLYLTKETQDALLKQVYSLDNTAGQGKAILAATSYGDRIKGGASDEKNLIANQYIANTDLGDGLVDYVRSIAPLMSNADDPKVWEQIQKITEQAYSFTLPTLFVKDYVLNQVYKDGLSFGEAMANAYSMIHKLKTRLYDRNDDLRDIPELKAITGMGSLLMTYGIPEAKADLILDSVLRKNGVDDRESRFNFISDVVQAGENVLKHLEDPSFRIRCNKTVSTAVSNVTDVSRVSFLVSIDDSTGTVYKNVENINKAIEEGQKALAMAKATGMPGAEQGVILSMLNEAAKSANTSAVNPYVLDVYAEALATITLGLGATGVTEFYRNDGLSKDAQNLRNMVGSRMLLLGTTEGKRVLNKIQQAKKDVKFEDNLKTVTTSSNGVLQGHIQGVSGDGGGLFISRVRTLLKGKNIALEQRDALEALALEWAVADTYTGDGMFLMSKFKNALDEGFTKHGNYKLAGAYRNGVTVEEFENVIEEQSQYLAHITKLTGVDNIVGIVPDFHTGNITFVDKETGAPLLARGSMEGPLSQTGIIPMQIRVNPFERPANMSLGKWKEAVGNLVYMGGAIAALMQPGQSDQLRKMLAAKGIKTSEEDFREMAYTMASAWADPSTQQRYIEFYAKGGKDTILNPAPSDMIEMTLGLENFVRENKQMYQRGVGMVPEQSTARYAYDSDNRSSLEHINSIRQALNFMYTASVTGNKAGGEIPVSLYADMVGIPLTSITNATNQTKNWAMTSITEGVHAIGKESHGNGFKNDFGGVNGWYGFIVTTKDDSTNKLIPEVFDELGMNVIIPFVKAGAIRQILTNRPELVAGIDERSKDPAFEKYRNLRNIDGSPVFVWDKAGGHRDHLDVAYYEKTFDPKTNKEIPMSSTEFVKRSTPVMKRNLRGMVGLGDSELEACATFFWKREATDKDAKRVGIEKEIINRNALLMAQTQAVRFADYKSLLGSTQLAIAAMHPDARFKIIANPTFTKRQQQEMHITFNKPNTVVGLFNPVLGGELTRPWEAQRLSKDIIKKHSDLTFTAEQLSDKQIAAGLRTGAYTVVLDPSLDSKTSKEIQQFMLNFSNVAKYNRK